MSGVIRAAAWYGVSSASAERAQTPKVGLGPPWAPVFQSFFIFCVFRRLTNFKILVPRIPIRYIFTMKGRQVFEVDPISCTT